jgi:hypothetical protein
MRYRKGFLRGRAIALAGVAVLVAASAGVLASGSQAGATGSCGASCFVAPTGSDSATGTSGDPLLTIQAGINATSAGGTLHVAAGTYDAANVIDHSLTLLGANAGIAGTGSRGSESRVERLVSESGPVFTITTTSPVTINGFDAQFNGTDAVGGVLLSTQTGNQLTFSNNLVDQSTYNNVLVYDTSATTSTFSNNLFTFDHQTGSGGTGVVGAWGSATVQGMFSFTGNTFSHLTDNDGVPAINFDNVGGVLSGNTFEDIHQYGILLADNLGPLTISSNVFDQIHNDTPGTSGNRGSGVRTFGTPTFVGPVSITGNTFSNSYHGVRVANDTGPATVTSNLTVNRNAFLSNSQADISLASGTIGTLNGSCNWWGQASGPGVAQTDGSVTTSPFLGSSNLMGGCPAPPPPILPTVAGAPRKPSGVPGNGSVKLSWIAPLSTGGAPVSGYVVTPYVAGAAQSAVTFNSTATTEVVKKLKNGTTYSFKVAAKNSVGVGAAATTGFIIAGAPGRPGAPKVTSPAAGKLRVGFKAPATNGSKITGYTAICDSPNGGAEVKQSGSKSPIVVTGASAGKKYYCIVVAKNARGTGPRSLASSPPVAV